MNTGAMETWGERIARLVVSDPGKEADLSYKIDQWIGDFEKLPLWVVAWILAGLISVPVWFIRFDLLFQPSWGWPQIAEASLIINTSVVFFLIVPKFKFRGIPVQTQNHPCVQDIVYPSNIKRQFLTDEDIEREEAEIRREREEKLERLYDLDIKLTAVMRTLSETAPELYRAFMEDEDENLTRLEEEELSNERAAHEAQMKQNIDRLQILKDDKPRDITDPETLEQFQ